MYALLPFTLPKRRNLNRTYRVCFCVFSGASSAEASAVASPRSVAAPGAVSAAHGRVSAAHGRVSATTARAPAGVPETADQPVPSSRRHRILRVQGRRLSTAGDSLDETWASSRRQSQVSHHHIFDRPLSTVDVKLTTTSIILGSSWVQERTRLTRNKLERCNQERFGEDGT